jgi:hypothetical protein
MKVFGGNDIFESSDFEKTSFLKDFPIIEKIVYFILEMGSHYFW